MGFLLELLASIVGAILGDAVLAGFQAAHSRGARRRLLEDGRVFCGLRAVTGRVYNMGGEWSTGTATIGRGFLMFDPNMGIVERRRIDVTEIDRSNPRATRELSMNNAIVWELVTPKGRLEWAINRRAMDVAAAALKVPITPGR